ncbi:MAG: type II secretion system F family protein [Nitrospirae bacterium]|nr:type II secretion system F family protein [Nitrospirota bacterium]
MNYFMYKAISSDGTMTSGMTEAEDINAAFEDLSSKGLSILDVRQASSAVVLMKRFFSGRKIKRPVVIEFTNNLSVMLKAGIPIISAFEDIMDTLEDKNFKAIVSDMKSRIESGTRFSDAIDFQREAFPSILVRLVRVGEDTGRLDKSLADVADHLQKMENLAQAIKRALIYPAFAIVTTLGALTFWLAYVLPKIVETIKDMGVKLPLITRILMHISDFMKVFWFVIPLSPVVIFIAFTVLKQNEQTRYYVDALRLRLPIVKLVVYNKMLALFSEQMRILVMSGIPIDRSLEIVSELIGNDVFKRGVLKLRESVSEGNSIADSMKKLKEFPQMVIRMVGIGETSGSLDDQFGFLSTYYLNKLDDIAEKLGKMVEPIVIGVVGTMFAFIVIGLMLPIYDLVSKFGKM